MRQSSGVSVLSPLIPCTFTGKPSCREKRNVAWRGRSPFFFFKFIYFNLFYFFWAALGFPHCARAFSSCSERELLFVAVHGLLIAVASLVVEHGL